MDVNSKIILFGALFHDIGKFQQRIQNERVAHSTLGGIFLEEIKEYLLPILEGDENNFEKLKEVVVHHHNKENNSDLLKIVKLADHLSASERVGFDKEDSYQQKWSHKYLSSLFSKLSLADDNSKNKKLRFYDQKFLNKKDYKILIPKYETESDLKNSRVGYPPDTFLKFKDDVKTILKFYKNNDDFDTVINLLLILFEKFMWCIPDFTGSESTDISLYNHIKDVAGISHAILKSDNSEGAFLNLIIGDLQGIQKYIFDVANKWPAKMLRGRSIYVQVLTRQFATIILNNLGLTNSSLIMDAGGKFYIIAPYSDKISEAYDNAIQSIDELLEANFNYELRFSSTLHKFNYEKLKSKKITFGEIIEDASYDLLQNRNKPFKGILFEDDDFDENLFILANKFYTNDTFVDSNSIKCAISEKPIFNGKEDFIEVKDEDNNSSKILIAKQIKNELKIGKEITKSNVLITFDTQFENIYDVKSLNNFNQNDTNLAKIILNPNLDDLLNGKISSEILRKSQILEVANYCTLSDDKTSVMDFESIENKSNGAKFLTLIKGDVDNLGLIMAHGLSDDSKDLNAISRTTTLSNHLKYFFSFSLNGFLNAWENGKVEKEVDDNFTEDQKVYSIFAGGDDIMLVSPQSSSLKLVTAFNKAFNDFVCENPEIHISYSLTNFKHNTPVRIVADMAEENQSIVKNKLKGNYFDNDKKLISGAFHLNNDKAGVNLFNTMIKITSITQILELKKKLIQWESDGLITQGLLRNLLLFSEMINNYKKTRNTKYLMWHPKLTYLINRTIKNGDGNYKNSEVANFIEPLLKINKSNDLKSSKLEEILYALICEVIYGTRNKSEK